jgi:hypothetical protein
MIPRLTAALIRVETDLRLLGVEWALIGGLAVSARTEPRTTRDVDLAVAVPNDREAESLVRNLLGRGYRSFETMEQSERGRLATVRLLVPDEDEAVVVDLLFASSGIEREVTAAAEMYEVLPRLVVPLARVGHLLALKVLALRPEDSLERPQDRIDIRELLRVATLDDLNLARQSLDLIERRGFNRKKDLLSDFETILARFRESRS